MPSELETAPSLKFKMLQYNLYMVVVCEMSLAIFCSLLRGLDKLMPLKLVVISLKILYRRSYVEAVPPLYVKEP